MEAFSTALWCECVLAVKAAWRGPRHCSLSSFAQGIKNERHLIHSAWLCSIFAPDFCLESHISHDVVQEALGPESRGVVL